MASIDPGRVATSPFLSDSLQLVRRVETVNAATGRAVIASQAPVACRGVVTMAGSSNVQRTENGAMQPRAISIVTRTRMRGVEQGGGQPDWIIWRGITFTVTGCDPYPQFGRGFYQVEALSEQAADPAL